MPMNALNSQSFVRATRNVVSTEIDGETILLNLQTGVYSGLNEVGTIVWKFVQQGGTMQSIRDHICRDYVVDPEECLADLQALLMEMEQQRLIIFQEPDRPVASESPS